ncbi:MAG: class I SAM-dependent methyltransferase, partial [Duodenibacillus sp.]|nr:class I SAM-dependent methyltransferase [Duodenibacillus sp.]
MQSTLSPDIIGAQAAALGVDLSPQQCLSLQRYAQLLAKWNASFNLTSIRAEGDVLVLHLLDSLTLVPALEQAAPTATRIVDVGSGGGLPGI